MQCPNFKPILHHTSPISAMPFMHAKSVSFPPEPPAPSPDITVIKDQVSQLNMRMDQMFLLQADRNRGRSRERSRDRSHNRSRGRSQERRSQSKDRSYSSQGYHYSKSPQRPNYQQGNYPQHQGGYQKNYRNSKSYSPHRYNSQSPYRGQKQRSPSPHQSSQSKGKMTCDFCLSPEHLILNCPAGKRYIRKAMDRGYTMDKIQATARPRSGTPGPKEPVQCYG